MVKELIASYGANSIKSLFISEKDNIGVAVIELEKTGVVLLLWKENKWVEAV